MNEQFTPFELYLRRTHIQVGGPLHGEAVNFLNIVGYRSVWIKLYSSSVYVHNSISSEAAELLLGVMEQEFMEDLCSKSQSVSSKDSAS